MAVKNALRYRDGLHENQERLTPAYVLDPVRAALGGVIELDPCTTPENPVGATRFYTPPQDGLALPWYAETIFCNPPYGRAREPWVAKCIEAANVEGARVVLLMPAHPDTKCFQRAAERAQSVVFLRGRLKFGTFRANRIEKAAALGKSDYCQEAASHPSALFGFAVNLYETRLGVCMHPIRYVP
jgi:hypothetical protein